MILLLGKNPVVEEYAEKVMQIDIYDDLVYYPDITAHHTELGQFVEYARKDQPAAITTQNLEMIDELLKSDLDFDIITVRKYDGELRTRTKSKEELISLRDSFDFDPRD